VVGKNLNPSLRDERRGDLDLPHRLTELILITIQRYTTMLDGDSSRASFKPGFKLQVFSTLIVTKHAIQTDSIECLPAFDGVSKD